MSRGKLHCVVAAVALVGFLAVVPARAEAAGGAPAASDFWGVALRWVASWWDGVLNVREDQGAMIDPNGGNQAIVPPSPEDVDEGEGGGMLDPNY